MHVSCILWIFHPTDTKSTMLKIIENDYNRIFSFCVMYIKFADQRKIENGYNRIFSFCVM